MGRKTLYVFIGVMGGGLAGCVLGFVGINMLALSSFLVAGETGGELPFDFLLDHPYLDIVIGGAIVLGLIFGVLLGRKLGSSKQTEK